MMFNPFRYGLTQVKAPEGRGLWLYGEADMATGDVYQPWKQYASLLQRKGCNVFTDIEALKGDYDAVFVNCPKQQEETQALIARALELSKGFVMAAAPNNAGGARLKNIMESFGLKVEQSSKNHFRIIWALRADQAARTLIKQNKQWLIPQRIEMGNESWWTMPGLFGWNKIDSGSKILIKHLPVNLSGRIADFGCGYGYLSIMVMKHSNKIDVIDAYDADARAVECCKRNGNGKVNAMWQDITSLQAKGKYDTIIMNPPFHTGKDEDVALGRNFIETAWKSLKPRGRLFMVANQTLPYEKVVPGLHILFEGHGFKVLTGSVP